MTFPQISSSSPAAPVMTVFAKSVYGETKFYPANEAARAYADALGTKTLTTHALRCAKRMGFAMRLDIGGTLAELALAA